MLDLDASIAPRFPVLRWIFLMPLLLLYFPSLYGIFLFFAQAEGDLLSIPDTVQIVSPFPPYASFGMNPLLLIILIAGAHYAFYSSVFSERVFDQTVRNPDPGILEASYGLVLKATTYATVLVALLGGLVLMFPALLFGVMIVSTDVEPGVYPVLAALGLPYLSVAIPTLHIRRSALNSQSEDVLEAPGQGTIRKSS